MNCVEVLMFNYKGDVVECMGDNIFIVKDGVFFIFFNDVGIFVGIIWNVIIEIVSGYGVEVLEMMFFKYDVYVVDECFLMGSVVEVIFVVKVDFCFIGEGKFGLLIKELIKCFCELVNL